MVESVDVGIVVVNRDYEINVWNIFMQNHSGLQPGKVINKNLFDVCPDISKPWMEQKLESVWLLNSRAFTIWEQRPYLFRFDNYRPITGAAEFMYQNITFVPLASSDGSIDHVCMIIYDVTDTAVNKSGLVVANYQLEQLSRTDQLTQLNNRGYWEECLDSEFLRLRRSGYEDLITAGMVLTGGSSKVKGLIDLAEEIFHMPVRMGVPQHISGLTDVVQNPVYSTGVGLLLYGREHHGRTEGVSGDSQGLLAIMKNWFQGNF